MEHPAFDITNPPACEHLLFGFASSVPNFHAEDGSGYKFMADAILKVGASHIHVESSTTALPDPLPKTALRFVSLTTFHLQKYVWQKLHVLARSGCVVVDVHMGKPGPVGCVTLQVDKVNSQMAARLVDTLVDWEAFDEDRQQLMLTQLKRIAALGNQVSEDVMELVELALED